MAVTAPPRVLCLPSAVPASLVDKAELVRPRTPRGELRVPLFLPSQPTRRFFARRTSPTIAGELAA